MNGYFPCSFVNCINVLEFFKLFLESILKRETVEFDLGLD